MKCTDFRSGAASFRLSLSWRIGLFLSCLPLLFASSAAWALDDDQPKANIAELRQQGIDRLRKTLDKEQRWVKVHAAEFLLALGYPERVAETFTEELEQHAEEPEYRVGIWRVLARASLDDKERERWVNKIRDVLLDVDAPDRLHAAETLAKLKYVPEKEDLAFLEGELTGDDQRRAVCVAWILADANHESGAKRLGEFLQSEDPKIRSLAAYAVWHLASIPPALKSKVSTLLEREPRDSPVRVNLLHGAGKSASDDRLKEINAELAAHAREGEPQTRYSACEALAELGTNDDLPLLKRMLENDDADTRSAAAVAVLRLERRASHGLKVLDWGVIVLYIVGMLVVGWYYSRRTVTTDDYLLGGRNMNSLSVGLSLFATLLSTITYLAYPGEIIRWGPMILATICAYPFVYFLVGWFMIPFIMKLKITSAYELLETRLGVSVRVLGSTFFLAMRLLWMAVIIYATTDTILVPLMGLDSSATPWLCALLGVITLIYTSMGGLRAVVFTDVTQTLILFGGAILALVLITISLGGVGQWWPASWPAHWPEPVWSYSPEARITFVGAMLAQFTWWVCTAGSDQMAIQRYLATRDAKTARNVLFTSLAANIVVALLLAAVGMALLAYFRYHPHFLADGQTILNDADRLFPRYIAIGLPSGLSGLVVAGLLAAAMSSLSSGVNSSCSVITVDFIDRFRRNKESETDHVRLAKWVSVAIGVIVVALSAGVGLVQGNLFEIAYKVVNLLTAPLFGLFFMAMFVRWATASGTLIGAVVGVAVVVVINFWEDMTGSKGIGFLWAMPLSFLAQTAVGMVASLLPLGGQKGGEQ